MSELFGHVRNDDYRQGYLFAGASSGGFGGTIADADVKRRPGETALDYRIRRQYRDVAATAPLFFARGDVGR